MVHNIHINGGNEVVFIHFIGYYMANSTYKKMIELVYQLQLYNKKIISTAFKMHENARKCIYNATETCMAQCIFF